MYNFVFLATRFPRIHVVPHPAFSLTWGGGGLIVSPGQEDVDDFLKFCPSPKKTLRFLDSRGQPSSSSRLGASAMVAQVSQVESIKDVLAGYVRTFLAAKNLAATPVASGDGMVQGQAVMGFTAGTRFAG